WRAPRSPRIAGHPSLHPPKVSAAELLARLSRPANATSTPREHSQSALARHPGFPVVLLNELVNNDYDHYRLGYHDEFDIPRLMDFAYATDVVRAALQVIYWLAQPKEPELKI